MKFYVDYSYGYYTVRINGRCRAFKRLGNAKRYIARYLGLDVDDICI